MHTDIDTKEIRINFLKEKDNFSGNKVSFNYSRLVYGTLFLLIIVLIIGSAGVLAVLKNIDDKISEIEIKERELLPVLRLVKARDKEIKEMESILSELDFWNHDKFTIPVIFKEFTLSTPPQVNLEELKSTNYGKWLVSGNASDIFSVLEMRKEIEKRGVLHRPVLETMWRKKDRVIFVMSFTEGGTGQ